MSVQRKTEASLEQYLVGAAVGALTTLAVAALVMMALGGADTIVVAQHAGPRFIAYATMVVGGLAGAALAPGVIGARAGRRVRETHQAVREQLLPLAVLGGAIMGLAALGIALPAAATIERFVKLTLALTIPAAVGASSWLSIFVTLLGLVLFTYQTMRLLDRAIRRSRAAAADATARSVGAVASEAEHAGARRISQRIDTVLRVGLGATIGAGLALRIASIALQTMGARRDYPFLGGPSSGSQNIAWAAAILASIGGGVLGLMLDNYWRVRARRPVVPLGAWFGHTPVAWLGGILTAKLLSGVAFTLARVVFVPLDVMELTLNSLRPLMLAYVVAGFAWMFIIGRAAARAIDAMIVRQHSLRLPQGKVDVAS